MHQGHRERLKQRFLKEGLDSFEDHQVLELLLFFSIPRKDTNSIAHLLLEKYGSLSGVLEAPFEDLSSILGIGKSSAILLNLIPHISRVYLKNKHGKKIILNSSQKAGEYIVSLFTGMIYEVFYLVCLDSQNRITYSEIIHEGTIDQAAVYPRIVVETALRHKASSVIIAHNHPGGSLIPSKPDIDVTKKIITALETISIKVIDHIIVADNKFVSFAEKGLLL